MCVGLSAKVVRISDGTAVVDAELPLQRSPMKMTVRRSS